MKKDNIINLGRELIVKKGLDYLSVRKLSAHLDISVGYFYGRFPTMDKFVNAQNDVTLEELLQELKNVKKTDDAYVNINRMADVFVLYAKNNEVVWSLLSKSLSWQSSKSITKVISYIDKEFSLLLKNMSVKQRKISTRLLVVSMFSVSNLLIDNPQDIKVLLNTYIAGLKVLESC
ncbi:MAG: TetR family transcriptional regulator [Alphaproteobacteria bacterium]